jgi:hypothetical protein
VNNGRVQTRINRNGAQLTHRQCSTKESRYA